MRLGVTGGGQMTKILPSSPDSYRYRGHTKGFVARGMIIIHGPDKSLKRNNNNNYHYPEARSQVRRSKDGHKNNFLRQELAQSIKCL